MSWPDYQNQNKTEMYPTRDGRDRDWEQDHRRRHWDDYERGDMSASYGDRRGPPGGHDPQRGRSRSPTADDGRKRRRSPSPWDRSRYEPRPRYGDDRDFARSREDYNSSSSRRGNFHGHGGRDGRPGRPPPPNPYDMDHPAQLKQFAEWFRYMYPEQAAEEDRLEHDAQRTGPKPPKDGIRARWEKYKKDFTITQISIMFEHHKKSPWFAEKYDPAEEFDNLRKRVRKEGWKGRASQFLLELEEGKHDPVLSKLFSETIPELSSPTQPISSMDVPTKPDLKPAEDGRHVKQEDEDMPFGIEAEDDVHDPDSKTEAGNKTSPEDKRSNLHDVVSVMPEGNEVMIRTIPPDIGRIKLEEVCSTVAGFVHLALGEPLQKRNFYRAGWIKFNDDTDMEKAVQELGERKVDGFKLHVTHTTRPFVTRVRIAPDAASRPERIKKDLANVKLLAANLENEAAKLRLFSPSQAKKVLAAKRAAVPQSSDDTKELNGKQSKSPGHQLIAMNGDGEMDVDVEAEIESEPEERGIDAVERRIEKAVSDLKAQSTGDLDGGIGWEAKKDSIALDFYLAYLRTAFNTCYYCAAIADHVEELQRKCVRHIRKPLSAKILDEIVTSRRNAEDRLKTESDNNIRVDNGEGMPASPEKAEGEKPKEESREWKRNDERWLDWLDSKIALLVNRSGVDPREYGGKDYDEELAKACEPHVKQEDEGKFRCKQCNKLFKAIAFVEKHVANKHPELIRHLDELPYHNNFALDPHRIQPFSHPPPQVGNSVGAPPQAYGLKAFNYPQNPGPDFGSNRGPYPPYPPYPLPPPGTFGGFPQPYHDGWNYIPYPPMYPQPMVEIMSGAGGNRRLGDRLGGFADPLPTNVEGLPPKPSISVTTGGRRAPPPDAREDPRASGGRKISYHDIDKAAAGDDVNIELSY